MTKKMLIDASHSEETRVIVLNENRLEGFDIEVESRKQLKGNIYLAKVTRVEPSLQAAFVEYGGNRHGFLAFSEIHPDYYQIPVADRDAITAEEKAQNASTSDDDDIIGDDEEQTVETLGGDDSDDVEERRPAPRRNYKIQEVIKRRQIILIQVVKEERGNKGAALTTYLSLAGRYCVLMPNTARGGGISRKITNMGDRKRLKTVLGDLGIPEGIAVIVRTAGSKRSKTEIKRDYDYLMRLWTSVRDLTLVSSAPCLVHEEANLIKRSIRDLYNKDISEIIVQGEESYRLAKDFMKLLIPSHAKKVQPYRDETISLTNLYQIEDQLSAMHSPTVQLKSGGYLVINPTEALVSIDVNSGRATKERNIEDTAVNTNLEAADEIARQLRLRDLAGLVVIDFIDMEHSRNQTKVERQIKEAMRTDRARIQIGRISAFGLLEMSRQRLRPSLIETSSEPCPHCEGTGIRRSTDTTALHVLRSIEDEAARANATEMTVFVPTAVALFILNTKREAVSEIETSYKISIILENDDTLVPPDYRVELVKDGVKVKSTPPPVITPPAPSKSTTTDDDEKSSEEDGGKRRRRRGRRKKKGDTPPGLVTEISPENKVSEDEPPKDATPASPSDDTDSESDENKKRRRRGRRGGRRRGRRTPEEIENAENAAVSKEGSNNEESNAEAKPTADSSSSEEATSESATAETSSETAPVDAAPEPKKREPRRRRPRTRKTETSADSVSNETKASNDDASEKPVEATPSSTESAAPQSAPEVVVSAEISEKAAPKPRQRASKPAPAPEPVSTPAPVAAAPEPVANPAPIPEPVAAPIVATETSEKPKPAKKGWWRRVIEK